MKMYRDLIVWQEATRQYVVAGCPLGQKSMRFVTEIYRHTTTYPREEVFGLTSQIRRSAVSIPSNIAEGCGRRSTNEYLRFLQIAMASVYEIQTQLEISRNLEYLSVGSFEEVYESSREIERMLSALIQKIRGK